MLLWSTMSILLSHAKLPPGQRQLSGSKSCADTSHKPSQRKKNTGKKPLKNMSTIRIAARFPAGYIPHIRLLSHWFAMICQWSFLGLPICSFATPADYDCWLWQDAIINTGLLVMGMANHAKMVAFRQTTHFVGYTLEGRPCNSHLSQCWLVGTIPAVANPLYGRQGNTGRWKCGTWLNLQNDQRSILKGSIDTYGIDLL